MEKIQTNSLATQNLEGGKFKPNGFNEDPDKFVNYPVDSSREVDEYKVRYNIGDIVEVIRSNGAWHPGEIVEVNTEQKSYVWQYGNSKKSIPFINADKMLRKPIPHEVHDKKTNSRNLFHKSASLIDLSRNNIHITDSFESISEEQMSVKKFIGYHHITNSLGSYENVSDSLISSAIRKCQSHPSLRTWMSSHQISSLSAHEGPLSIGENEQLKIASTRDAVTAPSTPRGIKKSHSSPVLSRRTLQRSSPTVRKDIREKATEHGRSLRESQSRSNSLIDALYNRKKANQNFQTPLKDDDVGKSPIMPLTANSRSHSLIMAQTLSKMNSPYSRKRLLKGMVGEKCMDLNQNHVQISKSEKDEHNERLVKAEAQLKAERRKYERAMELLARTKAEVQRLEKENKRAHHEKKLSDTMKRKHMSEIAKLNMDKAALQIMNNERIYNAVQKFSNGRRQIPRRRRQLKKMIQIKTIDKEKMSNDTAKFIKKFALDEVPLVWDFSGARLADHEAYELGCLLRSNSICAELLLYSTRLSDIGTNQLARGLKLNSSLTLLRMNHNDISDVGMCKLADALKNNNKVTKLNLCENKIADIGAEALGKLWSTNTVLTMVNISGNEITNSGAIHIAEKLRKNKTMRILHIWENKITPQGEKLLRDVKKGHISLKIVGI